MNQGSPPPVQNCELLVEAMGYWPSFHDAHVLSLSRSSDRCDVVLYVFSTTDEVDERGYFLLENHYRVSLAMIGVQKNSMPEGYDSDILFELTFEAMKDTVTVTFDSVMDKGGQVVCREVVLSSLVACGPNGDPPQRPSGNVGD